MDTIVSYTVMNSYPCPSNALTPAILQNMCLLTSPDDSTASTPSFLFHHSAQFFVFFLLFHFFSIKMWFDVTLSRLMGPVEGGQVLKVAPGAT